MVYSIMTIRAGWQEEVGEISPLSYYYKLNVSIFQVHTKLMEIL